jgi:hypothetical protein
MLSSASVVTTFLKGVQPRDLVADRYGGQSGRGVGRQICLAHLLRDTRYSIDAGDTVFAPGYRLVFLRAVAISKRRASLKDCTPKRCLADLNRRLDKLLSGPEPKQDAARRALHQQRLSPGAAAFGDLAQSDAPLPRRMRCQGLRPGGQRDRHRQNSMT